MRFDVCLSKKDAKQCCDVTMLTCQQCFLLATIVMSTSYHCDVETLIGGFGDKETWNSHDTQRAYMWGVTHLVSSILAEHSTAIYILRYIWQQQTILTYVGLHWIEIPAFFSISNPREESRKDMTTMKINGLRNPCHFFSGYIITIIGQQPSYRPLDPNRTDLDLAGYIWQQL